MNKEYWEKYYTSQKTNDQPSGFAKFCVDKITREFGEIVDIGCGNGRDTFFFASCSIPCIGVDQTQAAIEKNRIKCSDLGLSAQFHQADFSTLDYDALIQGPFSIYSRFTLHAINSEEESKLLGKIYSSKNLKYLLIEARTIRDELYGVGKNIGPHEFMTTHYRRFIDPDKLRAKLEKAFDIQYFQEAQGFSKTETEDPCLIRLIAKKR